MNDERDWTVEVDKLCELMTTHYLDAGVTERVNTMLRRRLSEGAYASLLTDEAFARTVTGETVPTSNDLHLRVRHSRSLLPDGDIIAESGRAPDEARMTGHGFARAQRLPGNIGLLEIRRFWPLSMSRHAAIGAMHLVADTDALVIDLRSSRGGEPEMVSYLCSYLFDERTHLNDLYFPAEDETIEWWTDPRVPGPTFGGAKPIWVLTSNVTVSAAEELAYDLQQQGRALLAGETTAGGANFDYRYRVSDHLMFSVPSGYPVNPVSGKGWEGTGVEPDLAMPPEEAYTVVYRLALEHVLRLGCVGPRQIVCNEARDALAGLP